MKFPLCRHIRTNGLQCQSPALKSQDELCFFHSRLHRRHASYRLSPDAPIPTVPGSRIELAPLEDRDSVQVALSVVINALATGQLETRRATAILYGLQLASNNAGGLKNQPSPADLLAVPAVEQTPEGLDLAGPGAVGCTDGYEDFDLEDDEADEDDDI